MAPSDLAVAFLNPLANWLLRVNPSVDPHLCEQGAEDAILSMIRNPRSYQPDKSSLDAYLRMSARGDLRNVLEKEQRHRSRRAEIETVEHLRPVRNVVQGEGDPATIFELEEDARMAVMLGMPTKASGSFTRDDDNVLALMRQGERRTAAYAHILGLAHLSEVEQRREVKRAKDRIKRRLQRARGSNERAD